MSQVNSKLTEKQSYWVQLPEVLCRDKEVPSISKDKCWNGMAKGRWVAPLLPCRRPREVI